jgi:hypothetical protein
MLPIVRFFLALAILLTMSGGVLAADAGARNALDAMQRASDGKLRIRTSAASGRAEFIAAPAGSTIFISLPATQYLTSTSTYADNYDAVQQACADLIGVAGISAEDCVEVGKALDAVEDAPWPCRPLGRSYKRQCWSSSYLAPPKKNTAALFKDGAP